MDNKYKECVENFEKLLQHFESMLLEEDVATANYNVKYLKQQPQYGEQPVVH